MKKETSQEWQNVSQEVLTGMQEWRAAHPKATFREIEHALHERMSHLEAQMLQDLALASKSSDWTQLPHEERPRCPSCHEPLQSRGKQTRSLQSRGGQDVELSRNYGTCPACTRGFFPAFIRNWSSCQAPGRPWFTNISCIWRPGCPLRVQLRCCTNWWECTSVR